MNLLDESQQVALAVRETPDEKYEETMTPLIKLIISVINTNNLETCIFNRNELIKLYDSQLRPGGELEMDDSAF